MLFSPRISTNELLQLCRRLATAIEAGIDARKIWTREAQQAKGPLRDRLMLISQAINQGESLQDAIAPTGDFFPVIFRELLVVGEQTGALEKVFTQLAEYYEYRLQLRRQFLAAITWPLVELGFAIVAIGAFIWIMGYIRQVAHSDFDPLGIGVYGNRGAMVYLIFVMTVAALVWYAIEAFKRGMAWTGPIQRAVLNLPVLGKALETLALARLAWSLNLTFDAGMEVRRALRLSLKSTNNALYTRHINTIDIQIETGNSIHEAFFATGCFPADFLDALAVGEETGKLAESMAHLARQYQEHAKLAFKTISTVGAFLVWLIIAAIIVCYIFQMAMSYIGMINQAVKM
ncbi:MAG: type II secretion system F family protein [Thermoguttaceae bacterium]